MEFGAATFNFYNPGIESSKTPYSDVLHAQNKWSCVIRGIVAEKRHCILTAQFQMER